MFIILSLDKVSVVSIYFKFLGMVLILNILPVKSCVRQHMLICVLKCVCYIYKYRHSQLLRKGLWTLCELKSYY